MTSDKLTVYEKPTCTKCRQANKLLRDKGATFERVNYYEKPFSAKKLKELLVKAGLSAKDILRTSESIYRQLGLAKKELPESELIALMLEHPDLIQRPIVERGDRAVLARPTENIESLLG